MESNQNKSQNTLRKSQTTLTNEQRLDLLDLFNNKSVGEKKYSKLDVLELGKPYNIIGWKDIQVRNRRSIILDLQEFQVWAPDRFSKFPSEKLDLLVQGKFNLVYYGKKKLPNNGFECHDIEIE